MMKMTEKKIKGYKIRYAGSRGKGVVVWLPFDPRKHICEACGKKVGVEIKITALHHWWYQFQPKTVKENPMLAIKNTSELCFGCHEIADAIRALLYANPQRIINVALLLTGKPRERFIKVLEELIYALKTKDEELAKKILEMTK
jgi:hypothetical protein